MDDNYVAALRYLSVPAGSFWKWDDQGAVVVWSNGSTIAFREELAIVLQRMSANGLPPLDAVLLLIAATRAYWAEDSLALQHLLRAADQGETPERLANALFPKLDAIHALPDDLIKSAMAKADLAAIVLEKYQSTVPSEVADVVCDILARRLSGAIPSLPRLRGGRVQSTKALIHDLWPLNLGLEGVSERMLQTRQKTGLDAEPDAAEIDFHVDETGVRSLLHELSQDDELAGLSRLARNLAAVVQLPRSLSDAHELPLGGVSDLTNRGALDRLLLSELAHDDLMLATRVALNEALYLRREVPPSFPPERRHVLIDSGLRMWGVPRVFSTAVALSLAASGGKEMSLSAYRASGPDVIPVDLSTRAGLLDHLGALETEVHPGRALVEFFQRVTKSDLRGDVVIVTTETVLDDAEFQRELSDADGPTVYLATVNREGDFQLWSRGPRGRKCHATLQLDLDALLSTRNASTSDLIDGAVDPDGPAIFKLDRFPFRMPCRIDRAVNKEVVWSSRRRLRPEFVDADSRGDVTTEMPVFTGAGPRSTRLEYGVYLLTRDHRLLLFDDSTRGALQLADRVPYGRCVCSWTSDDEHQSFAVIHRESEPALYLLRIDLPGVTAEARRLPSKCLSNGGPSARFLGITVHGGIVFAIFRSMIEAFDVNTRQLIASTYSELPDNWVRGRYFWNASLGHRDAWFALCCDGSSIEFQRVPQGKFLNEVRKIALFDRLGCDGPFAFDTNGRLINLADQTSIAMLDYRIVNLTVLDLDSDGRRALIRYADNPASVPRTKIVETATGSMIDAPHLNSLAQIDALKANVGLQPMRRLTQIFVADEQLTLVSNGHVFWRFVVRSNRLLLDQTGQGQSVRLSRDVVSKTLASGPHAMRVAEWDDGSRIWVDPRGLLHLQSSEPLIPEASFVLTSGVAAWTSDGRVLGSSYYVDDGLSRISPDEVMNDILVPFVSRLR